MTPREAHHNSHAQARPADACFSLTYVDPALSGRQLKFSSPRHVAENVFRNGTRVPNAVRCSSSHGIQSTVVFVAYQWGRLSCMGIYQAGLSKLAKSNGAFVRALTKLSALGDLLSSARLYGPSKQQLISRASLAKMSGQARAGFQANSSHQASCSRPSSSKSLDAIRRTV
jgi:hypothetical protein